MPPVLHYAEVIGKGALDQAGLTFCLEKNNSDTVYERKHKNKLVLSRIAQFIYNVNVNYKTFPKPKSEWFNDVFLFSKPVCRQAFLIKQSLHEL